MFYQWNRDQLFFLFNTFQSLSFRKKLYNVLRSPFVNKKSKEQFEYRLFLNDLSWLFCLPRVCLIKFNFVQFFIYLKFYIKFFFITGYFLMKYFGLFLVFLSGRNFYFFLVMLRTYLLLRYEVIGDLNRKCNKLYYNQFITFFVKYYLQFFINFFIVFDLIKYSRGFYKVNLFIFYKKIDKLIVL